MAGKVVSIHQPGYFPWLGYLYKVALCDEFVILDDVAANKAAYQYRNTFFCNGTAKFLTLPVNYRTGIKLSELEFTREAWRVEHLQKLANYYRRARCFAEVFPMVEHLISDSRASTPIAIMNSSMLFLFEMFGVEKKIHLSKDLPKDGYKGELVLSICRTLGASTYISGKGAADYMDAALLGRFDECGIRIEWLHFDHPVYRQSDEHDFVPGLSTLDLLFFNGVDASRKIFRGLFR